jgi:hypothetical protein
MTGARPWPSLVLLVGLTAAGLVLRLVGLTDRGLWLDEAISVMQASQPPAQVIATMAGGIHPPLFHLTLHVWMSFFGSLEHSVRTLTVIVGSLVVPATWWAVRGPMGPRAAWIAAGLVTASPFAVWYSQDARMYGLLMLFGVLGLGAIWRWRATRRPAWLAVYVAFRFALVHTHYGAWLLVVSEMAFICLTDSRGLKQGLRTAAALGLGLALASLPWAGLVALSQSAGAVQPPIYDRPNVYSLLHSGVVLGVGFWREPLTALMVAAWPALVLVAFAVVRPMARPRPRWMLLAFAGLGPIALVFGASVLLPVSVYDERYFAIAAPALFGLVAGGIATLRGRAGIVLAACIAVALSAVSLAQTSAPDNPKRYAHREARDLVVAFREAGDVVVIAPRFLLDPIVAYYPFDDMPVHDGITIQRVLREPSPTRRVWLVTSFETAQVRTGGPTADDTLQLLRTEMKLATKYELPNVIVRLYSQPLSTAGSG